MFHKRYDTRKIADVTHSERCRQLMRRDESSECICLPLTRHLFVLEHHHLDPTLRKVRAGKLDGVGYDPLYLGVGAEEL